MAWIIKTYTVVSPTPVVVEDPVYANTTVYQPGAVFEARENNATIVQLLADQAIVEVVLDISTDGYIIVGGDTGPVGPTGPGAFNDLAITLGIGNVTGGNDILLTGGDKLMGGRVCLGASTTAAADGDFSAGDATRDLSWDASTGALAAGDGTNDLAWSTAAATLVVSGTIDGTTGLSASNASAGTAAVAQLAAASDTGDLGVFAYSSAHATKAGVVELLSGAATTSMRLAATSAVPLELWTSGTHRWSVNAGGSLITVADDTHDIGIAAMNRPRTLFLSRSLDVGTTTGSTVLGDIKASDGTNELFWDASDGLLTVPNLHVSGTTTIVNSEIQTADNYILLNSEYVGDAPQSSGLVMNVDPAATSFAISDITSNVITVVAGNPGAALSAADFILVQDPANIANVGVYEVLSANATTITVDTTPAEPFCGNGLVDDATVQGTVVGVGLSIWESSSTGTLQGGFGTSAPISRTGLVGAFDFLNIGAATSAVATGDLAAGDGTREMYFDASTGEFFAGVTPGTPGNGYAVEGIHYNASLPDTRAGIRTALTSTKAFPFGIVHRTSGTVAAGFAATWFCQGQDSAGNAADMYHITGTVTDPANGTYTTDIELQTKSSATLSTVLLLRGADLNTVLSGDLIFASDNAEDIGASGATRPRTGYFGTSVVVGNTITIGSDTVSGTNLTLNGTTGFMNLGGTAVAAAQGDFACSDGTRTLFYDASAHTFLGAGGAFSVGTSDAQTFSWRQGGTDRWRLSTSGHLLGVADNAYDVGAAGATRPRTGYFGTSLNVGNGITPITANGDIVAGDGTSSMAYDASASRLSLTGGTSHMRIGPTADATSVGDFSAGAGVTAGSTMFWDQSAGVLFLDVYRAGIGLKAGAVVTAWNSSGVGGVGMTSQMQLAVETAASGREAIGFWEATLRSDAGGLNYADVALGADRNGVARNLLLLGNSASATGNARAEFQNNAGTITTVLDMDAVSLTFTGAATIDGSAAVSVGGASATAVNIGRSGITTDLLGIVKNASITYAGSSPVFTGELAQLTAVGMSAYFTKAGSNTYLAFRHSIAGGDATDFHMVMLS